MGESLVRWAELSEFGVSLYSTPVVANVVKMVIQNGPGFVVAARTVSDVYVKYLSVRFGAMSKKYVQPLALQSAEAALPVVLETQEKSDFLTDLLNVRNLPAIVLFRSAGQAKQFYLEHISALRKIAVVYVVGYSGGVNKILRNFSLRTESVLLATPEFVNKSKSISLTPKYLWFADKLKQEILHPFEKRMIKEIGVSEKEWNDSFFNLEFVTAMAKLNHPELSPTKRVLL